MNRDYRYRALNPAGQVVRGRMRATGPAMVGARLGERGATLLSCRRSLSAWSPDRRRRPGLKQLAGFTLQFEQLVRAGIPPGQALEELAGAASNGSFKSTLDALVESVAGGAGLADAFCGHPRVFGPVYAPLLRIGEQSGQLAEVLGQLADMFDRQDRQNRQARAMLVYPGLLGLVLLLVLAVLLGYLAPELRSFLSATGETPPAHTRALLTISDLWLAWWPLLPALGLGVPAGLWVLVRSWPRAALAADRVRYRLWLVGPLLLRARLARFANAFALAYGAGINVLEALKLGRCVVDSRALEQALDRIAADLAQGRRISESAAQTGLFPNLVVRMLAIGETTGQLDQALRNVSRFYERDLDAASERLAPLVAPAMILVLALLVMWIVLSVLGPIYDTVIQLGVGL